jgi:hypothetical protein
MGFVMRGERNADFAKLANDILKTAEKLLK